MQIWPPGPAPSLTALCGGQSLGLIVTLILSLRSDPRALDSKTHAPGPYSACSGPVLARMELPHWPSPSFPAEPQADLLNGAFIPLTLRSSVFRR